jgi:hypothetical protein
MPFMGPSLGHLIFYPRIEKHVEGQRELLDDELAVGLAKRPKDGFVPLLDDFPGEPGEGVDLARW